MDLFSWAKSSPAPPSPSSSLRNGRHPLTRIGDSRELAGHQRTEQRVDAGGAGTVSEAARPTLCTGVFSPDRSLPNNAAPINIMLWGFVIWGIFVGLPYINNKFSLLSMGNVYFVYFFFF